MVLQTDSLCESECRLMQLKEGRVFEKRERVRFRLLLQFLVVVAKVIEAHLGKFKSLAGIRGLAPI